LEKPVKSRTT